jgi:hypothetical protein
VSGIPVNLSSGQKLEWLSTIFPKHSTGKIPVSYPGYGVSGIFHKIHSTTTKNYSPER